MNGQFQPHQSMFSIRQRCLIGSLIWGYILTKVKVQNLFRTSALKYRPNCCQHFFSVNISILTTSKNFKLASAKGRGTSVKAQHQVLGKGSTEKETFSFGHCPNYLTPPPWPQFGQLGPLFSDVKIQDLKVSLELKNTIYTIWYTVYMQPIKQLKVQYIGIFEEIDSFYWPKMHF